MPFQKLLLKNLKRFGLLGLTLFPLVFCSCIREYHVVKKAGDGFEIMLLGEMPKTLVLFGGGVSEYEIRKRFGNYVDIELDSTGGNYMIKTSFAVDEKSSGKVKKMLPKRKGKQLIVPLDYADEYDESLERISANYEATYNLFVDKELTPFLDYVVLKRENGYEEYVEFHKENEYYWISFPIKWLCTKEPFVEAVFYMGDEKEMLTALLRTKLDIYEKLQEAYFTELGKVVNLQQIGLTTFEKEEYEMFNSSDWHSYIIQYPKKLYPSVMNCPEDAEWKVRSVVSEGGLCFEVILPNESGCNFTSTLCRLATVEKCGYTCNYSPTNRTLLSDISNKNRDLFSEGSKNNAMAASFFEFGLKLDSTIYEPDPGDAENPNYVYNFYKENVTENKLHVVLVFDEFELRDEYGHLMHRAPVELFASWLGVISQYEIYDERFNVDKKIFSLSGKWSDKITLDMSLEWNIFEREPVLVVKSRVLLAEKQIATSTAEARFDEGGWCYSRKYTTVYNDYKMTTLLNKYNSIEKYTLEKSKVVITSCESKTGFCTLDCIDLDPQNPDKTVERFWEYDPICI